MLEIAKKEALRLGWNVRCNKFLGSIDGVNGHLAGLLLTLPEKERQALKLR